MVDSSEQLPGFFRGAYERTTRGWLRWKLIPEEIKRLIETDVYIGRSNRVLVIGANEDKVNEIAREFENFSRSQGASHIQVEPVRHAFYITNAFFGIGHTYTATSPSLPGGIIYLGHIKHYEHTGKPEIGSTVSLNMNLGNGWGNPQTLLENLCAKYDVPLRKYDRKQPLLAMRALLPISSG